jgi:glutathione peroxidase
MKKKWWLITWFITVFALLLNAASIYNHEVKATYNYTSALEPHRGKVILIVNTATQSNFTPQLIGLEKLYQSYRTRGFEVIGFTSNHFTAQEALNDESVESFCRQKYGVTFPIFSKSDLNGSNNHALYRYTKNSVGSFRKNDLIVWSYTKYLIDRNGIVIHRYSPNVKPEEIATDIEKIL